MEHQGYVARTRLPGDAWADDAIAAGQKTGAACLRSGDELEALIKTDDWNRVQIIARVNAFTHIFNGHLMAQTVNDDVANRAMGGLLGFQLRVGPPMKLELRNIWLKSL